MFSHTYGFDPSFGFDMTMLLAVQPPTAPADFRLFWETTFQLTREIEPKPTLHPSRHRRDGWEVFEFECLSFGGVRIGGWVCLPQNRPIERGLVISHGYGGREEPDTDPLFENCAMIYPCARGLSLSRSPSFPSVSTEHVLSGIAARETYIHRGCAADIWIAATVLTEIAPATKERLDYVGTSFGGGIGALALPWDQRFHRAFLGLPSFGCHPFRLSVPCVGSGESVRHYFSEHPEVTGVLSYFDASTAARHLQIPTLVAAALFDPAVPPPGQFAVFNAIPSAKELITVQAGHFDWPGAAEEDRRVHSAIRRFLNQPTPHLPSRSLTPWHSC